MEGLNAYSGVMTAALKQNFEIGNNLPKERKLLPLVE
jgi:uncharacterized membrane protein